MMITTVGLQRIDRLIKANMDLLEKYKEGLRTEQRSKQPRYKRIKWYQEHIATIQDTLVRCFEYRKVCEARHNTALNKLKATGR